MPVQINANDFGYILVFQIFEEFIQILGVAYPVLNRQFDLGFDDLEKGDKVFVFTDGFEQYVKNSVFQKLFLQWDENLKNRIAKFSEKMNFEDPEKYGHERSLIIISF